jgi:hypothetical protein
MDMTAARRDMGGASAPLRSSGFSDRHGLWAPGVRIFRSVRFRAKAIIISAVFMLPIAVLAWSTQQNAALVEQTAAAADSLREQAERLAGRVAMFRFERPDLDLASSGVAGGQAAEPVSTRGRWPVRG